MTHSCCECKWCYSLEDSGGRTIELCVFDQSDNYLQEVGLCTEDCELDDYAEDLWQSQHEDV